MTENIRVFDSASLSKLRDEYKCTSTSAQTPVVPVIINGEMVKMSTGTYGNDHFIAFKNYADTSFTKLYSYMFLIYLSTGDYTMGVGTSNVAFMSFSSNPIKDSTTYYIPAGTYVCQVFVNAGARLFVTLKKKYEEVARHIYSYALKCGSVGSEELIYNEFYEQIANNCTHNNSSLELCKRAIDINIMDDPRFAAIKDNINKPGTIVNGEWVVTENTCPATCGTGFKKNNREVFKYMGSGAAEKTIESNTVDCSNPCPVNGSYSNWTGWSVCSKTCGSGTQSRTRTYNSAANGGVDLTDKTLTSESQTCNTQSCAAAYKIILAANKFTTTPISVTSPNGIYKFEWNKTPALILYRFINGAWSISSKINISKTGNTAVLSCGTEDLVVYNSSFTSASIISSTNIRPIAGFAVNDNGQLVFVNAAGTIVRYILTAGSAHLTV